MDNDNINNNENAELAPTPTPEQKTENVFAPKKETISLHAALSSPLILAFNILFTLVFAFSLFKSNFNPLMLLGMIGGWVVYGAARKKSDLSGSLGYANVVVKIHYVLQYVLAGCLFLGGAAVTTMAALMPEFVNEFSKDVFSGGYVIYGDLKITVVNISEEAMKEIADFLSVSVSTVLWLIVMAFGALMMLAGIIALLINILFTRKVSLFVGSLRSNATNPECTVDDIKKARAVKGWLMFVGILVAVVSGLALVSASGTIITGSSLVKAVSHQFSAVVSGILAASYIVLATWIKKHFIPQR